MTPSVKTMRPFVPSRDFTLSKRFYQHLGFSIAEEWQGGAVIAIGDCAFILQDFFVPDWAGNFMMQLIVDDLDAWWAHIERAQLAVTFGVRPPSPPKMQSWGLVVAYVVDPSGVLWHVTANEDG